MWLLFNAVLVSNVQQHESAYLYIHPLPFLLPCYSAHHRALSRVPCAVTFSLVMVFKIHKILHYISTEQSDGQPNPCQNLRCSPWEYQPVVQICGWGNSCRQYPNLYISFLVYVQMSAQFKRQLHDVMKLIKIIFNYFHVQLPQRAIPFMGLEIY